MPDTAFTKSLLFYLIPFIALICTANSCQTGSGRTWFVIKDSENRSVFHLGDTLRLEITGSKTDRSADSVEWIIAGEPAGRLPENQAGAVADTASGTDAARGRQGTNKSGNTSGLQLDLTAQQLGLGATKINALVWHEGKKYETGLEVVILSDTEPVPVSWDIVNTYPHDTSAYTQGLFYAGGNLYESTGRKGESTLRITAVNGKVRKQTALADDVFGEGACLLDGSIYQLTWKGKKGFIYNTSLERTGEFPYPGAFDGWGLTTDGRYLILSDGTHLIRFLDPRDSMKVVRTIQVFDHKEAVKLLNELEYVNGILYANVYTKNYIVGIDPASGKVLSKIDLTGLLPEKNHYKGFDEYNYVLNGIAHDPRTGHFYLTGKKWPLLFEVRFSTTSPTAGR